MVRLAVHKGAPLPVAAPGVQVLKIRMGRPILAEAEPMSLSDLIFAMGEKNPGLRALLLILHPADGEKLDASMAAKVPNGVGRQKTYRACTKGEGGVGIWSTLEAFFMPVQAGCGRVSIRNVGLMGPPHSATPACVLGWVDAMERVAGVDVKGGVL